MVSSFRGVLQLDITHKLSAYELKSFFIAKKTTQNTLAVTTCIATTSLWYMYTIAFHMKQHLQQYKASLTLNITFYWLGINVILFTNVFTPIFLLRSMVCIISVEQPTQRKVGSISDYDPLNEKYGSIAGQYGGDSKRGKKRGLCPGQGARGGPSNEILWKIITECNFCNNTYFCVILNFRNFRSVFRS